MERIETNFSMLDQDIPDEMFENLDSSEKSTDDITSPSISYWKNAWVRLKKDPLAMLGITIIIIITIASIIGPILIPYSYDGMDIAIQNQGPTAAHWFGTDKFGRDIFVRTLYGARISLTIGFLAAFLNGVIGVLYGGFSGFIGGRIDLIMMRIVDVITSVPSLLYIILIMMFLGNNIQSILIALCLTYWTGTARQVRSQILTLKHQDFVLAARVIGENKFQILTNHLIPNSMGPIIVTITFLIPQAIFQEAFLSFLGIGIQVPMASWGTLANDAIPALFTQPYQMFFPVLAISFTMLALNFIGDGLRDALDPRLKK